MTPADIYTITPEELFEVFEFRTEANEHVSLDDYIKLRPYASHEQALEIVGLGNIKPKNYIRCLEHGNATHDEVVHAAKVEVPGGKGTWAIDALNGFASNFDRLVETYVGGQITLQRALVAHSLGIPNDGSHGLGGMLRHAEFEDIVDAWRQLKPRQNPRTFCKLVIHDEPPLEALGMLPG